MSMMIFPPWEPNEIGPYNSPINGRWSDGFRAGYEAGKAAGRAEAMGSVHDKVDRHITKEETKATSDGSSTSYYKIPDSAKDLIDLIEHKNMNFAIGNIFKACYRLGQKQGNDDLYDLRKIRFFVDREITRLENETNSV